MKTGGSQNSVCDRYMPDPCTRVDRVMRGNMVVDREVHLNMEQSISKDDLNSMTCASDDSRQMGPLKYCTLA